MTNGALPPSSNCRALASGIRSLIGPATFRSVRSFQCSTPKGNTRRKPESSFGENQLLPGSISFSLQPTSHPKMLHNLRVRASLLISKKFTLLMGSSPGFGSDTNYMYSRYSHSLSLWLHPLRGLACSLHQLVGSFFNRHAIADLHPL